MALKVFKRPTLALSISLSAFVVAHASAEGTSTLLVQDSPTPATALACSAVETNSERLACYDALFKTKSDETQIVSERRAAVELAPEADNLKAKISSAVSNIYAVEAPKLNPNASLMDSRWELSPESKLGTWNIRAYQPVYLMPIFWTSNKNERPKSANPENTVTDADEKKN